MSNKGNSALISPIAHQPRLCSLLVYIKDSKLAKTRREFQLKLSARYGGGYDLAARRKNATRESTATLKVFLITITFT